MKIRGRPFQKGHKVNLGRKFNKERNKKISIALTGKILPLEVRNKIGKKSKGRMLGSKSPLYKDGRCRIPGYLSWKKNERGRIKKSNGGSHTWQEWEVLKAQYNWTCPCCKKPESKVKLTQDHIIAVSKGGSDNIENIQPLCQSCNTKKSNNLIKYEK